MRVLASFVLALAVASASGADQDRGLTATKVTAPNGEPLKGLNWLVLIAISEYKNQPSLTGPTADARTLEKVLLDRYAFDRAHTIELFDHEASMKGIQSMFVDLGSRVGRDDSVLIYYAGHGHTAEFSKAGYWIPYDGGTDRVEKERWLPNVEVRGSIAALKARHVLLVADSCFSGDLLNEQRDLAPVIDDGYFRRAYELVSRQVMTSGASETVKDVGIQGHSPFAYHLIDTLRRNDETYLDPIRLYDRVRTGVSGQLPLVGALGGAGHQEGAAYLFFLNETATLPLAGDTPPDDPTVRVPQELVHIAEAHKSFEYVSKNVDTAEAWRRFLERYGDTEYGELARRRVAEQQTAGTEAGGAIPSPPSGPALSRPPAGIEQRDAKLIRLKDKMEMVKIPAGTFLMGSDIGFDDERPVHRVPITRELFMDRHEVTVGQYRDVMGVQPPGQIGGADTPVVMVSWDEGKKYCETVGSRLPTEAEWEYAAGGGKERPIYPWGTEEVCAGNKCRANMTGDKDGYERTSPVCAFGAQGYDLCDMAGNVWEWVSDWYGPYAPQEATDPLGPTSGQSRVLRGGSWTCDPTRLRVVIRDRFVPVDRTDRLGFRCCRNSD